MAVTSIILTDPVSGYTTGIMPVDGVSAGVLDVAAPARAVTEDAVGRPGAYDVTRYPAAAAVSLSLVLYPVPGTPSMDAYWDLLAPLLDPGLRPALVVGNDAWPGPRQLTVRFDSVTKPVDNPSTWPVQITWSAPAAVWEDAAPSQAAITAFAASTSGVTVNAAGVAVTVAGVVFPATSELPQARAVNTGSAAAAWTAMLYGPCAGPVLSNDTTGGAIQFGSSLVLDAGDFLLIDSAAHTALLNGDPASSAMPYCNFATTTWWQLVPGENLIRYSPSSANPGSTAQVSWRSAWLA